MKILLLGSGAREHAMAYKLSQSPLTTELHIAPGNPGMTKLGMLHPMDIGHHQDILDLCRAHSMDMVICGPEAPLAEGLMDFLEIHHPKLILIGPKKQGAQLEASKAFAKQFMLRHNIPTARYRSFNHHQIEEAIEYGKSLGLPLVIKADGLAAGKGVVITQSQAESEEEIRSMLGGKFGDASTQIVLEEFLSGIEFSVFVLTNGNQYALLPTAKDYKRVGEADTGPNTGGMGSISPVAFADEVMMEKVKNKIILPTIQGLQKDGLAYQGFIFFGLIKVNNEPYVIEYNCRLGDPETESILLRLDSDLVELCLLCHQGKLENTRLKISDQHAATVFLVSGGYPGEFEKGKHIGHMPALKSNEHIFFAAVAQKDHALITSGGRVLAVSCLAEDRVSAVQKAMDLANQISFEGKYYRKDIGFDLS
ncbi:MAG: phosphoribosylamine--glycine ligase [Saprospiraceae bacterium]|nr:phosphoribosylamine--glycine ligase [Saprospiraceae bacterium]